MKLVTLLLLATAIFCISIDPSSSEYKEMMEKFISGLKKNEADPVVYTLPYQEALRNFRLTGDVIIKIDTKENLINDILLYDIVDNGEGLDNIKMLFEMAEFSDEDGSSPSQSNSQCGNNAKGGFYSTKGYSMILKLVGKNELFCMAIYKYEGYILKQVCVSTSNNLKTCYTIDEVNDDIKKMFSVYIKEEFRRRLNAY